MGRQSKWEYFRAVYVRYRGAGRRGKQRILDGFCANTRYQRKYAPRDMLKSARLYHPPLWG